MNNIITVLKIESVDISTNMKPSMKKLMNWRGRHRILRESIEPSQRDNFRQTLHLQKLKKCERITEFNICSFKITYIVAIYVAENLCNSLVKLGIELPKEMWKNHWIQYMFIQKSKVDARLSETWKKRTKKKLD